MSAILSTEDLNDFINPGIACIKPVETLPKQQPRDDSGNPYEVTTEDKVDSGTIAPPAQISLTDCLACSGCVTSAEAVLVSLQSHGEVLNALDQYSEMRVSDHAGAGLQKQVSNERVFVASVSPQSRASLAATYNVSERQAGHLIDQLLMGPLGVRSGGKNGSGFAWVIDTNAMREACLVAAADEVIDRLENSVDGMKTPVITSACPGWICYAEKTHPHILPHLSHLKSPQALTGVLLKSVLAKTYGIPPGNVWHLAVMPCFDKKLEASRGELTSQSWHGQSEDAVRDVDCVITARELLMLAESRGISFPDLPRHAVSEQYLQRFPEQAIHDYLFRSSHSRKRKREDVEQIGTSGGYLHHILRTKQVQNPGSVIRSQRGRNNDVVDFSLVAADGRELFRASRYYGFRNIQNLVRRLKPAKASRMPGASLRRQNLQRSNGTISSTATDADCAYVEVMACPGGCTNGGGQIKVGDVMTLRQGTHGDSTLVELQQQQHGASAQRDWLAKVDEAYWSASSEGDDEAMSGMEPATSSASGVVARDGGFLVDGIDVQYVKDFLRHWAKITGIGLDVLLKTTYRVVESDVGKSKSGGEVDRVTALAHAAGGGW